MMDDDGLADVFQAFLDAFNWNELVVLMSIRLHTRLDRITRELEMDTVIVNLLDWAKRNGRLVDLIQVAYEARSSKPDFVSIHQKYCAAGRLAPHPDSAGLLVTESDGSKVTWQAPFPPADVGKLWDMPPPFRRVRLALDWDEDDALCRVFLRLLCHHMPGSLDIEVRDNKSWMTALTKYQRPYLPVETRHGGGTGWSDCGEPLLSGDLRPREKLASDLEKGLDDWSLRKLNRLVPYALRDDSDYTGDFSGAHRDLRKSMLSCWKSWIQALCDAPDRDTAEDWARKKAVRRRFKRMLLSVTDGAVGDWGSFALGPATMESCMLPATLLALAVAVCLDQPWQPHERTPGNLSSSMFNGHACGVERVNGDCLEDFLDRKTSFPWNSHIVLLAKSRYSFATIAPRLQSLASSAEADDATGSLRTQFQPAVITLDCNFRRAMEAGLQPLRSHLSKMLGDLARQQRAQFDPPAPAPATGVLDHV